MWTTDNYFRVIIDGPHGKFKIGYHIGQNVNWSTQREVNFLLITSRLIVAAQLRTPGANIVSSSWAARTSKSTNFSAYVLTFRWTGSKGVDFYLKLLKAPFSPEPCLLTSGQARFPSGDAVDALNGECPRLVHEQGRVPVQLDLQHGPLHPHQRDQQGARRPRPDQICVAAVGRPPLLRRPQLAGQDFNGRRAHLVSQRFGHNGPQLSSSNGELSTSPPPLPSRSPFPFR